MDSIQVLVLAAGHGKRMKSEIPKVLLPLKGRPLLHRVIEQIFKSEIKNKPAIVVGQNKELVQESLGPDFTYVIQTEQLGTGHAVLSAKNTLKGNAEHLMVLYGDHPLVTQDAINKIARTHIESGSTLTMATVAVEDFNDWRSGFYDYGRIIRDSSGNVARIVEKKDSTEDELKITEVNPSYFCFDTNWLWEALENLKTDNAQKEYYLTALLGMAREQNKSISTVPIMPHEALGANTPEQLEFLEKVLNELEAGGKQLAL